MTQMVGAKLALRAIRRVTQGAGHHAGVVDEQINPLEAVVGFRRAFANAVQRRKIEDAALELGVWLRGSDVLRRLIKLRRIAPGHHDMRAFGRHGAGGLLPKTGIGPGDEDGLPRKVHAVQHLVGG